MPQQEENYLSFFNLMLKRQLNTLLEFNQRLNQVSQPSAQDQALRLFCFLYDRAPIPLEFWSAEAAAPYVKECLDSAQISIGDVSKDILEKWAARVHLSFSKPLVVTGYTADEGITKFSLEAWRTHGGPELAELQAAS
jgi:hypothetical protein